MRVSHLWPAVAIGLALTVAACAVGADPTTSQAGTSSLGGDTARAEGLAYAQCMRSHSVPNFPDPVLTPSGHYGFRTLGINPQSPAFVAATAACKSLLPEWWGGNPPSQLSPAQEHAWLTWAQCIRTNGVPNFPDPTFADGRVAINNGGAASSPQWQAAEQACKSQMPSGGVVGG